LTTTIGKLHETGITSIVTAGREASGTAIDCLRNTNRGSAKATCSIETCAEGFILFLRTITGVYLPPPRGYRYVFIGGHACLIDSGYRVHDVIHFELNY
jgi:hypothetical protein